MKFTFYCTTCAAVDGINVAYEGVALDIQDDGIYKFECPRGHKRLMEVQQERFEILFEIGVNAIRDSYYREAVSSFTAALERFYEFCIRVYTIKIVRLSGVELTFDNFEKAWGHVSKMSERQYGAYIFLHTVLTGAAPSLQSNRERNFRNRVIHEGIFSTRLDAVEYGDAVMKLIRDGIVLLRKDFQQELDAASDWSRMSVRAKAPDGTQFGTLFYPTTISIIDDENQLGAKQSLAQLFS